MLFSYGKLSEIKLKRTDTTLDLSQLAKRAGEERKEEEGRGKREVFIPSRLTRYRGGEVSGSYGLSVF